MKYKYALLLLLSTALNCTANVFHVYSPCNKSNTLWIVRATPKGSSLTLDVEKKVDLGLAGRIIAAHPNKPLLYITATSGEPRYLVRWLHSQIMAPAKHEHVNFNDGACYLALMEIINTCSE